MTTGRPQTTRKANARHAEIVATAAELFLEKGYEGTSVQDIADRVGLLKGSLFYYISSKEDLLYAVLADIFTGAHSDIERISNLDAEPLTKIRRVAEAHVRNVLDNRDRTTIFFRDFRSLSEERRSQIAAEREFYAKAFTELLVAAQADGAICPDIDVKLTSGSLLGMLNMVHEWYPPSDAKRTGKLAEEVADLVVASIRCDPATHKTGHRRRLGSQT